MISKGEDALEMGGYFIINGIEKLIRMTVIQRRHFVCAAIFHPSHPIPFHSKVVSLTYWLVVWLTTEQPMAFVRPSWKNRGRNYSEFGIFLRCVRADQTTTVRRTHCFGRALFIYLHKNTVLNFVSSHRDKISYTRWSPLLLIGSRWFCIISRAATQCSASAMRASSSSCPSFSWCVYATVNIFLDILWTYKTMFVNANQLIQWIWPTGQPIPQVQCGRSKLLNVPLLVCLMQCLVDATDFSLYTQALSGQLESDSYFRTCAVFIFRINRLCFF